MDIERYRITMMGCNEIVVALLIAAILLLLFSMVIGR
jgi:hypothetical protein